MKDKNYIFDLYGTLVDIHTDEESPEIWDKASACFYKEGAAYGPQELKAAFQDSIRRQEKIREEIQMEEIFRELLAKKGVMPDHNLIRKLGRQFRGITTEYIRLYPGAKELLAELKRRERKIFLLTNAQRLFTVPELHQLGIYDDFDGIFISSDYGIKKPNPAFFEVLLKKCALSPDDCLMVGNDRRCDIQGAAAVGMEALYLHTNLSPEEDRYAGAGGNMQEFGSIKDILGFLYIL